MYLNAYVILLLKKGGKIKCTDTLNFERKYHTAKIKFS